jgi:hypothetical protein
MNSETKSWIPCSDSVDSSCEGFHSRHCSGISIIKSSSSMWNCTNNVESSVAVHFSLVKSQFWIHSQLSITEFGSCVDKCCKGAGFPPSSLGPLNKDIFGPGNNPLETPGCKPKYGCLALVAHLVSQPPSLSSVEETLIPVYTLENHHLQLNLDIEHYHLLWHSAFKNHQLLLQSTCHN